MAQFFSSEDCRSGRRCEICRDRSRGKDFREELVWVYGDVHREDFDCPHGRKWGWRTPAAGLGDTVERVCRKTGIERLVTWYAKKCGRPCNCQARKKKLNTLFPYRRRKR